MSDSGGNIESYSYLGLSTLVREIRPGSVLTYVKASGASNGDAGDMYTGLDRFGRVVDQLWATADTVSSGTGGDTLGTTTDEFQYGYDNNSNVLYKNNMIHSVASELYHANSSSSGDNATAYDPLNRLTAFRRGTLSSSGNNGTTLDTVTTASATNSWSLDALGNSTNTGGTSRTFNSKNQFATYNGSSTITYDHDGNVTTDQAGTTYTYDAWNRLISALPHGIYSQGEVYTYNAIGERPGLSLNVCNGAVTSSYYSTQWQDLEDDVTTYPCGPVTTKSTYLWGEGYIDDLIARDTGSTRVYAQQDANHDITSLTNSSGTVLERFVYDPYGARTVLNASWSTTSDTYSWVYGLQGGRLDPVSGLVNFRTRDLNPTLGVWMEEDNLAEYLDGSDLYQFVQSNPINRVDPAGLKGSSDIATAGSIRFISIPSGPINPNNSDGSSADRPLILPGYGTVVVYAQNDSWYGGGRRGGGTPAGGFELKVTKANGCPCTRLQVSQQVKITVNGHLLPSELQHITDLETDEHLGHNPLDGFVLDNGTMQFPPHPNDPWAPPPGTVYLNRYQPELGPNQWKDRNAPFTPGDLIFGDFPWVNDSVYPKGAIVMKEYIVQLYCDGAPIGPKFHWTMQGTVGNGQTSAVNVDLVP